MLPAAPSALPFSATLRRLLRPAGLLVLAGLAMTPPAMGPATAKDGGGHSDGGGHGGDSSGSGSSGSGSSGSGSSGSGSSGSGKGGSHGGESSGRGGKGHGGTERSERKGKTESRASGRVRLDSVVWSARREGAIEVRYADGWSEKVDGSGYTLCDPGRRVVASRPAKPTDYSRLEAIAE